MEPQLHDLSVDTGETANIASRRPDIASRLLQMAERMRRTSAAIRRLSDSSPNPAPTDPRLLERLRSLGYIR